MRALSSHKSMTRLIAWCAGIVAMGLALAPWWRNRAHLRELLDYGVIMAGVGRIEEGQRPFIDFGTPLQSASLWLNWVSECLFGQTFLGMTWGNVGLITLGFLGLHYLLRNRFPTGLGLLISWVVIVASAGQHTIIWYNSIGVITLAAATWAAATSPLFDRKNRGATALACAALVVGGCNKLNFHLVALALVMSWTIRAVVLDRAQWRNGVITLLLWGLAGVVVPLGIELGWTGASLASWQHNVLGLAAQNRSGMLASLGQLEFYLVTTHDYYGPVLKPAGVIILVTLVLTGIFGWKKRILIDRVMLLAAIFGCSVAAESLLATNREIVYVSLGAALAVTTSLWLGFNIASDRRWPWATLWIVAGVIGSQAWISAWHGQRMLYGHHSADRQKYRTLDPNSPQFAYFARVKFAPEVAHAIETLSTTYQSSSQNLQRPAQVFFTRGLEALYRITPFTQPRNLPLWVSDVTYGPLELNKLRQHLTQPAAFDMVVEQPSWNYWPEGIQQTVERFARSEDHGIFRFHHLNAPPLSDGLKPVGDPIGAQQVFGGNLDSQYVRFDAPLWSYKSNDGTIFLGTNNSIGSFTFQLPVNRIDTRWFIRRSPQFDDTDEPELLAHISIKAWPVASDNPIEDIWATDVTIPSGVSETSGPVSVDAGNRRLQFAVDIPAGSTGRIIAGWQLPTISHSAATTNEPPHLRLDATERIEVTGDQQDRLFSAVPSEETRIVLFSGRVIDNQIEIDGGGQIWVRALTPWAHLRFNITAAKSDSGGSDPVARMLWYEGGRLQMLQQAGIPDHENGVNFHGWPAEDYGWFGLLIDANISDPSIYINLRSLQPED